MFSPGTPKSTSCGYDPYSLLRLGGFDNLAGNARDLAFALMPLMPYIKDPTWIKAAQNFLCGAIIYYFGLEATFIETMMAIQTTPITKMIDDIIGDNDITAKIYMSKLSDVQDKVIVNIGMELSNLATLVTDPAIINAFSEDEQCGLLDWSELSKTTEPFDVILRFPDANMERWEPLMMLMINQLIK